MALDDADWKKSEPEIGWIWSYADLMSLLLAFFVMLFAISQTEQDSVITDTLEELSKAFKGQSEKKNKKKLVSQTERESRAFRYLMHVLKMERSPDQVLQEIEKQYLGQSKMEAIKEELEETNLVQVIGQGMSQMNYSDRKKYLEFIFSNTKIFDELESKLSPSGINTFKLLSSEIRKLQHLYRIEIVSHTSFDEKLESDFQASSKNADLVADFLIRQGIQGSKIKIVSRGPYNPIVKKQVSKSSFKSDFNRRVHVVVYEDEL